MRRVEGSSDQSAPTGLVGREGELAAIELALSELGDQRDGALFITGEPGIGKTALVHEILARASAAGCRTFTGRASEFELDVPYAIFTTALETELTGLADHRVEVSDDVLKTLSAAFPSLFLKAEQPTAPTETGHRVRAAVRVLLSRLADEAPVVMALDDLHWADPASIDLVCHLLHRGFQAPVLLVLAARVAQVPARLVTVVEEAERVGRCRRLDPGRLSPHDVSQLLGDDIGGAALEQLYRESEGNPFYVEQLAGAARRGQLRSVESEPPTVEIPAVVSAAIRQEVDAVSDDARQVLQAAAALGESFDPELLARTASLPEHEVLPAIDELAASDLLRPAESPNRFRFRHPILRRVVYQTAGPAWRMAAHRRAAEALKADGAPTVALASHVERYAAVGDDEAIEQLVRAGEQTALRAPATAAAWFAAALRLIPDNEENLERRLGLLVQRAAALGIAGDIEENREALRAFMRISPRGSNPLRLKAAMLAALLDDLAGEQDRARQLLLDELAALPDDRSADAAELMRILSLTAYLDADWGGMRDWAQASLSADCRGMVKVGALSALGLAGLGLNDVEEGVRNVSKAAQLFDELTNGEVNEQPGITAWLGWAEVCAERFEEAVEHLERATAVSGAGRHRPLTVGLYGTEAQALAVLGNIRDLTEVVDSAFEAALNATSNLFLSWAMQQKCALELHRGDLFAAVRYGEQSVSLHAATGSPLTERAHLQLAEALLEIGEPERASEQLTNTDDSPRLPPFPPQHAGYYELRTRLELAFGRRDEASHFAQRAHEVSEGVGLRVPLLQALRAQATVALAEDRPREALDHAMASVRIAEEAAARVALGRARVLAGRALAAIDDRDRAVAELQAGHELLSECGATHYCNEAARELRRLGHVVRASREMDGGESLLSALTPRELEVLELVAIGKTNRQVAGQLYLSVRTVDSHVSRVFEKLGVNSRAAAASEYQRARPA
ncbi:MAG: helix-turn-helix transcriptional regulator [Solirubrobacteraceae bacterium]